MTQLKIWIVATSLLCGLSYLHGAIIVTPGVNVGVTTDLLDFAQGGRIDASGSTASPIFPYERAIGFTGVGGETTNAIFANGGVGATQSFTVRTPSPITLEDFQLSLAQDPSGNRSASRVRIYASQDNITFTPISDTNSVTGGNTPTLSLANYNTNYGNNSITISDTPNVTAQFFRVETRSATASGPRIREFDGFGSVVPYILDTTLFNYDNNIVGAGDEAPGLTTSFSSSALLAGESPAEVFGNVNMTGPEPGALIFSSGIRGFDYIEWQTSSSIDLAGFEINLSGDGGGTTRGTEAIRFFVEGNLVDLFDNNHMPGSVTRLFSSGTVTGDNFRIELDRSLVNSGPRIYEINAVLAATTVPEPGTMVIFAIAGLGLLSVVRRQRRKQERSPVCSATFRSLNRSLRQPQRTG